MALPSLQLMLHNKLVKAVGVPSVEHEATTDIKQLCSSYGITPAVFHKHDLNTQLSNWIEDNLLDIILVFTFPYKIPGDVIAKLPKGIVNFHFGLLPQYRGADAIFWQIKNKEDYGGISVHKIDAGFDTGPIIHIERVPILHTDTYGMQMHKLAHQCINVLHLLLPKILSGNYEVHTQKEDTARYYSKPGAKDVAINWQQQTASDIVALINACNPWNKGAYTMLNNNLLRITSASVHDEVANSKPGIIAAVEKNSIKVNCIDNSMLDISVLSIDEGIYPPSLITSFISIKPGDLFHEVIF